MASALQRQRVPTVKSVCGYDVALEGRYAPPLLLADSKRMLQLVDGPRLHEPPQLL